MFIGHGYFINLKLNHGFVAMGLDIKSKCNTNIEEMSKRNELTMMRCTVTCASVRKEIEIKRAYNICHNKNSDRRQRQRVRSRMSWEAGKSHKQPVKLTRLPNISVGLRLLRMKYATECRRPYQSLLASNALLNTCTEQSERNYVNRHHCDCMFTNTERHT